MDQDLRLEDMEQALLFAVANGWRPPRREEMSDEERERPTLRPPPKPESTVRP